MKLTKEQFKELFDKKVQDYKQAVDNEVNYRCKRSGHYIEIEECLTEESWKELYNNYLYCLEHNLNFNDIEDDANVIHVNITLVEYYEIDFNEGRTSRHMCDTEIIRLEI